MSIRTGPGESASSTSWSKMEPDTTETKKICSTLKRASLEKSPAWTAGSAMWPSSRVKTRRIMGSTTMRTARATGATWARTWSRRGLASEAAWRKGRALLRESTREKLATTATGTVQSRQSAPVRALEASRPACTAACGRPTLAQHTQCGGGASTTHRRKGVGWRSACCAAAVDRRERKVTKAQSRTGDGRGPGAGPGSGAERLDNAASC